MSAERRIAGGARLSTSASTYDGFFFRDNLAAAGAVPASAPYSQCPDVIGSNDPIDNAQSVLSTLDSWATNYRCDASAGVASYYYLRGMNGSPLDGPKNNRLSLFWTPAQLLLFPSLWKNNPMSTSSGSETVAVSADSGHIGVGGDAFVWTPPSLPYGSTFFSFVASAQSDSSPSIPSVMDWLDLGQMLTQQLCYGWRTMTYVDPSAPTWLQRVGLTIPASVGSSQTLQITISASGFANCTLALLFDHYGAEKNLISLAPFQLSGNDLTGFSFTADPGLSGSLAIQLWNQGGANVPSGSTIDILASIAVSDADIPEAVARGGLESRYSRLVGGASVRVGPQSYLPVGGMTIVADAAT